VSKASILREFKHNPIRVLETIGLRKVRLKSNSVNACCPLHSDSNPSFSIFIENGVWTCFAGCGTGDLFSLYGKLRGINSQQDFPELLREFTTEIGLSEGNY
jgi:DNA primase